MMTGESIICLSSIDWSFLWQGHHEIMVSLAKNGNRVLFVENTGVRAPGLRDFSRLRDRLRNWLRGFKGFRQERENLFVYSPLLLPLPYSSWARRINRFFLVRALQQWMQATGTRRPILWTFLPTPLALDVIRALEPDLTVYYCIDDLGSSSKGASRIYRSESALFRLADLVFVTSEKLRQRAASFNDRVHFFPFGVDFNKFERIRKDHPNGCPQDLQALPHPIVGYVGGVHQWIDQELLTDLAGRMEKTSFVLVGPHQTDVSRLSRFPNVHFLGSRAHEEIPRYIKSFDVGIVPYRSSEYTDHVYPTKLNEYLAMGIPVVTTDLPEIRRFNLQHGPVVAVARDAAEFKKAIEEAVRDPANKSEERIEVARQNGWERRIAQMSTLMETELVSRRVPGEQWKENLRRLFRRTQQRLFRWTAGVAAAYLLLFHSPFLWFLASPLKVTEPIRPAEAIVVFAGGVGESGKAGGGYQERVKWAIDLYQSQKAHHLIFSSGYRFVFQEAQVMKELAVSHGVPASAILLETQASNTLQNVMMSRQILDRQGWRSILLVSSPYHMRRALWTWRKMAPEIRVTAAPVPSSQFYSHHWGANLEQIGGILHEVLGILYYLWKGWI